MKKYMIFQKQMINIQLQKTMNENMSNLTQKKSTFAIQQQSIYQQQSMYQQ